MNEARIGRYFYRAEFLEGIIGRVGFFLVPL